MADDPIDPRFEDELVARFRDRIRFFAARHFHLVDDAEDVAQETLRRVLSAYRERRIENLDALPGFVLQTAKNVCLQRLRSAKRESSAVERFTFHEERRSVAASPDPLLDLIGRAEQERVRQALARLDAEDRNLLLACFSEEKSGSDVAVELGVAPGALRVRKHRALRRLAKMLEENRTVAVTPQRERDLSQ